jgi:hypothetical protein
MDEIPVSFDMPISRTVNLKGAKEVSVATTGHERSNFTVVLCITADGSKLPPMMIFKRKTVPKGCNSKDVIISANEKGWMNSEVMKFWLDNVWRNRKMAFFNPKSLAWAQAFKCPQYECLSSEMLQPFKWTDSTLVCRLIIITPLVISTFYNGL